MVEIKRMSKQVGGKYIGILALLSALIAHTGRGPVLGSLDIAMFRAINQDMQSPLLNSLAATASDIGSSDLKLYIYIFLLVSIILVISIIGDNKELKKLAILLLIAFLISGLVVNPLKSIFGISRPYVYLNGAHVYSGGKWSNPDEITSYVDERDSFPSGHAALTFPLLGVLWSYRRLRSPVFVFLILTMFLIVYAGQHYVSDIIAGGATGFVIGYLLQKRL